ncbi:MAG: putative nucleic acid-binding Zn-ribbon protein [Lentisphaeria bacterium]|jgi:predicted  nucleic acid-binding Zn-ribbon protein
MGGQMPYTCIDCGYKGSKIIQGGCPGCGSKKIKCQLKAEIQKAEKNLGD